MVDFEQIQVTQEGGFRVVVEVTKEYLDPEGSNIIRVSASVANIVLGIAFIGMQVGDPYDSLSNGVVADLTKKAINNATSKIKTLFGDVDVKRIIAVMEE